MPHLRKPDAEEIASFLDVQRGLALTYRDVGATASGPPTRYVVDHARIRLGEGPEIFDAAKSALQHWRQFHTGWLEVRPPAAATREGEVLAIVARSFGLWWLNACRIVYVVDEDHIRFGYAYGTLPGHVGSGEERFLIEQDAEGTVWYDVLAFSRPRHLLAKIGYPYVRRVQKRFGRDSSAAMRRAVNDNHSTHR